MTGSLGFEELEILLRVDGDMEEERVRTTAIFEGLGVGEARSRSDVEAVREEGGEELSCGRV